ncbi:MAG TPA: ATP-binding cassette domain-containing protein [Nocardioides sp.]|uniref:ABC transporter ATP-binding protein n=1 Tax=Nocardioides sp. TaxID=35761 RepID=UPI002E36F0BF|nr:ATP-binding cassette domain-containing protein [Nocardioides sp.]HEX5087822.1 ATP-binding cassette domain-containing protein [Nocardioides sp.]
MTNVEVEVRGLTKTYGNRAVVADVSFNLSPGTVTGFLGPNGAGKSTTLRMMLGLVEPTAGVTLFGGRAYRDLASPARTVGAVLESGDFHPRRSGYNHLRVIAALAGLDEHPIGGVLATVGLTKAAHRQVRTYSLGMRQRLGLAAALLGNPQVLLLDEPANGLDPAGVAWLRSLLQDFTANGGTALVSSHLLAELSQSVDRVVVISEGRLLADTDLKSLQDGRSLEEAYLALTSGVTA